MPKIVDHEARREEISAALWRIVERGGISEASIRSVAKEAGYPKATAMHYFKNEAELLMYAMDEHIRRSQSEIAQLLRESPSLTQFNAAIMHAIPTTQQERKRSSIWLAIATGAQHNPSLRDYLIYANTKLQDDLESLLRQMVTHDILPETLDTSIAAQDLHALIDGLTLHSMTSTKAAKAAQSVVTHHIDLLRGSPK